MVEHLNNTFLGLENAASMSPFVAVPFLILLMVFTLFVFFKFFRKLVYGAIPTGIGIILYLISLHIVNQYNEGDTSPLMTLGLVIGLGLISIIVGHFVIKLKFIRELEKLNDKPKLKKRGN
jgi:H+/Cl- antiporter ClcA